MTDATGKWVGWRIRLKELEFDVVHREGIKNQAAEALSSLKTDGVDERDLEDDIKVILWK